MNLAPKNDRMWFVCWPSEYGLVPTDGTGYTHEASAWQALLTILRHTQPSSDWTKEKAQAAGWQAVRLWLSVKAPADAGQGQLFTQEQEQ